MPLDPQAQAMIDQMQAAGAPPLHTLPPEMARQVMAMMRPPSDQIEQVAKVEDRTVPTPDGDVPIRIYTPAGSAPFPVTVYLHGGGWVIGSIETHDPICRALANAAGCIVVSVDYRLAPEAKFPAAVNDSYAATKWVADHCASFGGNPSRVATAGDSAGGNLAAVVALLAKERGEPKLVFQLLVYPVTEHSFETGSYKANGEGYFLTTDAMRWFWGHYLNDHSDGDN
ncbi:MAG TPA: alpha/beta hydrolase, partial [Dehalococcoidia bacterium]|nr:alpha/beta hydrolase [Dehalococcoidia bacterium]